MESRQSYARNKLIAPLFKRLGIIDQWGNELKLIADEMRDYPNIELKWREVGLSFQVQFVKRDFIPSKNDTTNDTANRINDTANSPYDTINSTETKTLLLEIISKEEGLTAPILAEIIGKSLSTTKRYIKDLSDKVEFRGATKNGGYFIKK